MKELMIYLSEPYIMMGLGIILGILIFVIMKNYKKIGKRTDALTFIVSVLFTASVIVYFKSPATDYDRESLRYYNDRTYTKFLDDYFTKVSQVKLTSNDSKINSELFFNGSENKICSYKIKLNNTYTPLTTVFINNKSDFYILNNAKKYITKKDAIKYLNTCIKNNNHIKKIQKKMKNKLSEEEKNNKDSWKK